MFAVFTPIAWPTGLLSWIADPSRRTCIVSLVNAHGRPCRLKLKTVREQYAIHRNESGGPCFGSGYDVALLAIRDNSCNPHSFELDTEAESAAGLSPLPFAYDKTLLSGVDDGKGVYTARFSLAELECFTINA